MKCDLCAATAGRRDRFCRQCGAALSTAVAATGTVRLPRPGWVGSLFTLVLHLLVFATAALLTAYLLG